MVKPTAPSKFAPLKSVLCNWTPVKFALVRLALTKFALVRLAPLKSTSDKVAPVYMSDNLRNINSNCDALSYKRANLFL